MNMPSSLLTMIVLLCVIPIDAASQVDVDPRDQNPWQIAMMVYHQHGGFEFTPQQREFWQNKIESTEKYGDYGRYFDGAPLLNGRYYPTPKQIANFYLSWFAVIYTGDKQELWQSIVDYESIEVTQEKMDAYVAAHPRPPILGPQSPDIIRSHVRADEFLAKYPRDRLPARMTSGRGGYGWKRDHAVMGAWAENVLSDFEKVQSN